MLQFKRSIPMIAILKLCELQSLATNAQERYEEASLKDYLNDK